MTTSVQRLARLTTAPCLVLALAACNDKDPGDDEQADEVGVTTNAGTSTNDGTTLETGDDQGTTTGTDEGTTTGTGEGTDTATSTDGPMDTSDTAETDTGTTTGVPDACSDGDGGNAPAPWTPPVEGPGDPKGGTTLTFIPADDMPSSECDIFLQDCVDGEKCVPYGSMGGNWDANKCVPVLGDGMIGEPCTWGGVVEATDDCGADSACWDVQDQGGELIGTCTAFCEGTPQDPMCPEGTSCLISGNGSIAFCIDSCNPLTQPCPDGEACFWANGDFNCIFTTTNLEPGDPCGFINDCAEGNACLTAETLPNCAGSACCSEFCDLDCGPDDFGCSLPGTTCVAFFEQGQAPPGFEDVGVCILP